MKIARNRLIVSDVEKARAFYRDFLGMQDFGSESDPLMGYDEVECLLEFRAGAETPVYSGADGFYWKIGLTLDDLDTAVAYLRSRDYEVSDPRQFLDIGYMCHLRDPNGLPIELLQKRFEGNHTWLDASVAHAIGSQATLAHVTLRVSNLEPIQNFCEKRLGMRLLSVQPVELPELEFTLYFYAWSRDVLPEADLEAVQNREWLWARPYTLLEIQHLQTPPVDQVQHRREGAAGFDALGLAEAGGDISYLSAQELAG